MVGRITLLIGGLIILSFLVAGGGKLIGPAITSAKSSFGELKTGVSDQITNIKAKNTGSGEPG